MNLYNLSKYNIIHKTRRCHPKRMYYIELKCTALKNKNIYVYILHIWGMDLSIKSNLTRTLPWLFCPDLKKASNNGFIIYIFGCSTYFSRRHIPIWQLLQDLNYHNTPATEAAAPLRSIKHAIILGCLNNIHVSNWAWKNELFDNKMLHTPHIPMSLLY